MEDDLLVVACMPGLSHGSARLYAILRGVEDQLLREATGKRAKASKGNFFPVTLLGLQKLHPGAGGKVAGFTTIIKQVAELRQHRLLITRAAMPRNEPNLPVLVKLRPPEPPRTWTTTDGSSIRVSDVHRLAELQ